LDLIKIFVEKKLLDLSEYAKTIDRILLNEQKPQKYWTQVVKEWNKYKLYELEDDIEKVNKRRKEIWLEPLEDYLSRAPFKVEF